MDKPERISITELPDFVYYCGEDHYFGSDDPALENCPICAEIKAAYESGLQDEHYAMEETVMDMVKRAEKAAREEVLEFLKTNLAQSGRMHEARQIDRAYQERFK